MNYRIISNLGFPKGKTVKKALVIAISLSLSLAASATRTKIGPGCSPGIGDGEGNVTGSGTNTEVTLPVGLPVSGDPASSEPAGTSNIVYTFDLSDDNGTSSINQTHSAFEKARDMNAACVLIRIDGFAGGWDVAENIRQEILGYDRPVMVYVNNQAIPAASFISSGADSIYTKKGSTLANNKRAAKKNSVNHSSSEANKQVVVTDAKVNSGNGNDPQSDFTNDVTMNEILYKAGLSNLTVVEHQPGFAEKAVDFMMNPYVVLLVLLLVGFVMRKAATKKLPGPVMYALALVLLLYLAPFQLSGLASNLEILVSVMLVVAVITASRYHHHKLAGLFLIALTITFALVRAGDTSALFQYGSYAELMTLPAAPLGLVILGWLIGRLTEYRRTTETKLNAPAGKLANAA